MKCISVYTKDFAAFSDIYETIMHRPLSENEEKEIDGIVCSDSGEVDDGYLERLRAKPGVVVMRDKDKGAVILQHGDVFEIFMPSENPVTH